MIKIGDLVKVKGASHLVGEVLITGTIPMGEFTFKTYRVLLDNGRVMELDSNNIVLVKSNVQK